MPSGLDISCVQAASAAKDTSTHSMPYFIPSNTREVINQHLEPNSDALEPQYLKGKRYRSLDGSPQALVIGVASYGSGEELELETHAQALAEVAALHLDGISPFKVTASFRAHFKSEKLPPLDEAFASLGCYLHYTVTDVVNTSHLTDLVILLPKDEPIRFDPSMCPLIPLEALSQLRHLRWAGHPTQLSSSWLPFSSALLGNLESLYLDCSISRDDCVYLLGLTTQLKKIKIHTIKRQSQVQSVFHPTDSDAPIRYRGVTTCHTMDLELKSDDYIGPLFEHFEFPFLRRLTLSLTLMDLSGFYGTIASGIKFSELEYMRFEAGGRADHDWIRQRLSHCATFEYMNGAFVNAHYGAWDI